MSPEAKMPPRVAGEESENGATEGQSSPIYSEVLAEIGQDAGPRQQIIKQLAKTLGRCVAIFFTSFHFPVMIGDEDAQMLEDLLRSSDLADGLTLVLNSPGGDALTAERIINICRTHSDNNFEVIVPRMAKSAATMICFGAQKIYMMATAELGAIDPQVVQLVQRKPTLIPARTVTETYRQLLEAALQVPADKVTPYLQQLERYDARIVAEYENDTKLSEDIAARALKSGMMENASITTIQKRIGRFTTPRRPYAHGRGIGVEEARKCGLRVEEIPLRSPLSDLVWKLYVRTNHYVSTVCSKALETANQSFVVQKAEPREE